MSSFPGPAVLGRGIVIGADAAPPDALADAPRIRLEAGTLENPSEVIDQLHLAWVGRVAHVIEWDLPDDALAEPERTDTPPWDLEPVFLFPLERLRFLVFTNNYDARDGDPKWWWTIKAAKAGITDGGETDGMTSDGTPVWIDGGPRQPLAVEDEVIVHGETVELGNTAHVRPPSSPNPGSLANDQLEAVAHTVGPARIIAPAGSGKTRTLVARLRHLLDDRGWPAEHTLVLAYNRRAADELVERLEVGRGLVRTIHSLGWAILQEARPGLGLVGDLDIRNEFNRLVQIPKRPNADPIGPYLEALESVRIGL
ncbi:MAG TPA: ATP-dependent helicase, partial [Actinobacteria bacterium]|nr:ATP-dependent helicase [Actinomycetota bacterium]